MMLAGMCNIVVAVVQCRLVILGFLTLDATNSEDEDSVRFGALGFEDQTVAVRWAQDNAAELEV